MLLWVRIVLSFLGVWWCVCFRPFLYRHLYIFVVPLDAACFYFLSIPKGLTIGYTVCHLDICMYVPRCVLWGGGPANMGIEHLGWRAAKIKECAPAVRHVLQLPYGYTQKRSYSVALPVLWSYLVLTVRMSVCP